MQRQGFRLGDMSISGLEFRPLEPGQERRSLVDLLYGLNYPAEYRLELLQTLSHYEQALDALLELAAPYARRLEEAGGTVELHEIKGVFHGYDVDPRTSVMQECLRNRSDALRRGLWGE